MNTSRPQRILVIKLSSLGDFVLSIGGFQAIRAHHGDARITLLTTAPFVALARASGCFDEIWTDERPPWWRADRWLALARRLRRAGFERVYDLQRSQRSGWYFRLAGRPQWVGTVAGCSHRYEMPRAGTLHIAEREAAQLALAGIAPIAPPDLSFLTADVSRFGIEGPYALLIPGGAAHMAVRRWPAERYAAAATWLAGRGIAPVLICGPADREAARTIAEACPEARDLETDLDDIAALARGALFALGNETGPTHIVTATGCPCLVLSSGQTDPRKTAPRGPCVSVLRETSLQELTLDRVLAALAPLETEPRADRD